MIEHFFQCPYCWETISMLLEPMPQRQHYIEDCEVCCRPIELTYSLDTSLDSFEAAILDQ